MLMALAPPISRTTLRLPPDQTNSGRLSWSSRSTSVERAERMGPTGPASVDWKIVKKRVMPSTISS